MSSAPGGRATKPCNAFSFTDCGQVGLVDWLLHRSDESKLFAWAKKRGTPAAWEHYLNLYAKGPRAAVARTELENASYVAASTGGTSAGYRAFLARFPGSRHVGAATAALELAVFNEASAANQRPPWEAFLREFPSSTRAPEARQRIEALRRAAVLAAKSWRPAMRHLLTYPRSPGANEVRALAEASLADRAAALRSPGMVRLHALAFPKSASSARVGELGVQAPPPAPSPSVSELNALMTMVPLLGRFVCAERVGAKLAALTDAYGTAAEELRGKLHELFRLGDAQAIDKAAAPAWCQSEATLTAAPAALGEALAYARSLVALQGAARSAAGALKQVIVGKQRLEWMSAQAKDVISKADVFEQRWQALGAPQELQDVQTNASKLGEHVRDRAAALLAPTVQMEQRMRALFQDVWDSFVATAAAAAILAAGAP